MKTRKELIEAAARTEASSASFGGWHSWENMPRDIQEVFLVSVENAIKSRGQLWLMAQALIASGKRKTATGNLIFPRPCFPAVL